MNIHRGNFKSSGNCLSEYFSVEYTACRMCLINTFINGCFMLMADCWLIDVNDGILLLMILHIFLCLSVTNTTKYIYLISWDILQNSARNYVCNFIIQISPFLITKKWLTLLLLISTYKLLTSRNIHFFKLNI